jgi:hypothetical protein
MCPSRLPDVQPTFAYVPDRPFDNPILLRCVWFRRPCLHFVVTCSSLLELRLNITVGIPTSRHNFEAVSPTKPFEIIGYAMAKPLSVA